jgi:mono/diheme cytochrome c family protein
MRSFSLFISAALAVILTAAPTACGNGKKDEPAGQKKDQPADPAAVEEADQVFLQRCATCHGPEGQGDGQAAAALNPKPRNFHDKAWQSSVGDARIAKVIVEGGQAIGKSPVMAANPDLKEKPGVITALVAKVRAFGK